MWDRYDPRSDDRDRGKSPGSQFAAVVVGSTNATAMKTANRATCSPEDLDLPRGRERRPVRERDRIYEIDGTESRMLGTIGAFRVVSESDLHDLRDEASNPRGSVRHLEDEGLIRRSPLSSDDRAVVLTERGRDLLEANRYERPDRTLRTSPDLLRGPQEAARADARHQGLSSLPARRRAPPRPGRSGPAASFSTTSSSATTSGSSTSAIEAGRTATAGRIASQKRLPGGHGSTICRTTTAMCTFPGCAHRVRGSGWLASARGHRGRHRSLSRRPCRRRRQVRVQLLLRDRWDGRWTRWRRRAHGAPRESSRS